MTAGTRAPAQVTARRTGVVRAKRASVVAARTVPVHATVPRTGAAPPIANAPNLEVVLAIRMVGEETGASVLEVRVLGVLELTDVRAKVDAAGTKIRLADAPDRRADAGELEIGTVRSTEVAHRVIDRRVIDRGRIDRSRIDRREIVSTVGTRGVVTAKDGRRAGAPTATATTGAQAKGNARLETPVRTIPQGRIGGEVPMRGVVLTVAPDLQTRATGPAAARPIRHGPVGRGVKSAPGQGSESAGAVYSSSERDCGIVRP